MKVKAKKHLGQHFLKNPDISQRICDSLDPKFPFETIIEIGPGTGALTRPLTAVWGDKLNLMEIDIESIQYQVAIDNFPKERIFNQDFLRADLSTFEGPIAIAGNFPYNISTQIIFKVLDERDKVCQVVGMFQKEVAERICSGPGSKVYGIMSLLAQVFYDCEYLFTVGPQEFDPPPKVNSGVMIMTRKKEPMITSDYKLFKTVVKLAFGQRRKTMRNSLKSMLPEGFTSDILSKRPEQLSIAEFDGLICAMEEHGK